MRSYREVGLLAEGGMAVIAHAERDDGCPVVIKRVRPPYCFDPAFLRLFADEGAVHASLEHENIVRLLDRGQDAAGPYLVFEHVDGTDLSAVLEGHARERAGILGGLDVEAVVAIALPLCRALAAAHEATDASGAPLHVVHRDVSPGNVLLSVDGDVKLADFGVASFALKTEATVAGELKGKFAYMAPEQTRGEQVGPRTDLFAAGIVLWEAISGRRLFDGPTDADVVAAVRSQGAAPLHELRPDLPPELSALVAELLAKDPEKRPESARAVAARLEEIARGLGLDEGLRRCVARVARLAPRTAKPVDDSARRRTQRVLAAEAQVRRPRERPIRFPWIGGAAVLVGVAAAVAWLPTRGEPVEVRIETLPDDPPPRPPLPTPKPTSVLPPPTDPVVPAPVSVPSSGPSRTGPSVSPTQQPAADGSRSAARTSKTSGKRPAEQKPPPGTSVPAAGTAAVEPARVGQSSAGGFGQLSITSEPWASVTIDGTPVARETPLKRLSLAAGRHEVILANPVFGSRSFTVEVRAGEESKHFFDLTR